LSLRVEDKELLVLLGPSGCGKTTTLRLIAGLESPSRGAIFLDGLNLDAVPPKDRGVAMMFQEPALYPHMTVGENLSFGLKLRGCPKAELRERMQRTAELLEIADCLARKPASLSGGQRQRVALGRAIVQQPKVLLLDEPLSNLDPQLRLKLRAELRQLQQRLELTMIYVTHDQAEAMTLGHRVAVMQRGKLQQVAEPATIYQQPANTFVAEFIGSPPINLLKGTLVQNNGGLCFVEQAGTGAPEGGRLQLKVDSAMTQALTGHVQKPVLLGLRAENIVPAINGVRTDAACLFEAEVKLVEQLGWETHVHFGNGETGIIARIESGTSIKPKQRLPFAFCMERAHFFDGATGIRISPEKHE